MKYISTILSLAALIFIAILFYLFINHTEQIKKISVATEKQSASTFRIAYFDMDSLEAHYAYFQDAQTQFKAKQNLMNTELNGLQNKFQKKVSEWQQKGSTMTQAESQQAQQEYTTMEQSFQARKQALGDELAKDNEEIMIDIKKKIENFLNEYNTQKNFAYIIAFDQGSFIYHKDSTYNITGDVINGLNADYKKKK
jgi:outer membrane protein